MRRQATSPLEIEQIKRVGAMLGSTVTVGTMVAVTTADGRTHIGKVVSHQSGGRLTQRGKVASHYGSIELATAACNVEINYLDVVYIAPQ
jgi:hypothetical protein